MSPLPMSPLPLSQIPLSRSGVPVERGGGRGRRSIAPVLVVRSPLQVEHHPKELHPFGGELLPPREVPRRAEVILAAIEESGSSRVVDAGPLDLGLLARVHSPEYLAFLETAHARWCERTGLADGEATPFVRPYLGVPFAATDDVLAQLGRFSHDSDPLLAGTWRAATGSAASAVDATSAVLSGERVAYSLSRPPGHHAAPASFGGFCYLNNVAVAAERALLAGARVATLDVDAHAGNGTQAVFWGRDDVLCVSLHADPAHEYPYFAGHHDEIGTGAGEGFNLNLPLAPRSGWDTYGPALDTALRRVAEHGTEVLVVALGVDTAIEDGVLAFGEDDFRRLGSTLADTGLPTVLVQEGGYDLDVLGRNVVAVLDGFAQHA